jgi:hypothetical protein
MAAYRKYTYLEIGDCMIAFYWFPKQIAAIVAAMATSAASLESAHGQRASRRRHSLEEELRQILDEAARAEVGNPDALEPLGSFIVRITRPGHDDVAAAIDAQRQRPDRPLPVFE